MPLQSLRNERGSAGVLKIFDKIFFGTSKCVQIVQNEGQETINKNALSDREYRLKDGAGPSARHRAFLKNFTKILEYICIVT